MTPASIAEAQKRAREWTAAKSASRRNKAMTHEELIVRVQVLEEGLSRLAGALIVLFEAIDDGTEKTAARAIRELLQTDLDELSDVAADRRANEFKKACYI